MTKVKVSNIFPNLIATKTLNLKDFKIEGSNFKKTFESQIKTTLKGKTQFNKKFIDCLNISLTEMLNVLLKPYCKNYTFNVTHIWINKYGKKDYQGSHVHPSDFSFILYYKTDKSHTIFNSPSKNLLECLNSTIFDKHYEPNLKQGDILVFPSYLEHWVEPNSNNLTVSGNIKILKLTND